MVLTGIQQDLTHFMRPYTESPSWDERCCWVFVIIQSKRGYDVEQIY